MENSRVVLKKIKNRTTIEPGNSISGLLSRSTWDVCTPMVIAALVKRAKKCKQSKCPWTDEWINQVWYIHTRVGHSASRRKEILSYATIWMNLEDIVLSEISQSPKKTILDDSTYVMLLE